MSSDSVYPGNRMAQTPGQNQQRDSSLPQNWNRGEPAESGVSGIDRANNLGSSINRTPSSSIPQPGRIMKKPGVEPSRSVSYDPNNQSASDSRGGAKSSASLASSRSLFGKGKGAIFG